ncbi:hypothetical protein ACIQM4_02315 [Streptomyces sp. NPDC091272]|uniref:hypothetical protein n=1 Tax=Streptomyces sp. NPDC091272 TaxID=3365981 RepID=UPI00380B0A3A
MTARVVRLVAQLVTSEMPTSPRTSPRRVLEDLGPSLLDLAHGRDDLVQDVGGVVIHDPGDEVAYPSHAIVLGVAVHGTGDIARLLTELGGHGAGADVRNRLRSDLVSTVLEGGAGAADALDRLGFGNGPTVVMALGLAGRSDDHARTAAERERLTSALGIHLDAVRPRSALALLGDVAYAIVPVPGARRRAASRRPGSRATSWSVRVGGRGRSSASVRWRGNRRHLCVRARAPTGPCGCC